MIDNFFLTGLAGSLIFVNYFLLIYVVGDMISRKMKIDKLNLIGKMIAVSIGIFVFFCYTLIAFWSIN